MLNKQIPTAIGILIILLVAGVAGVSIFFLSQEDLMASKPKEYLLIKI